MERTKAHRRFPLIRVSIIVLLILLVCYIPFRVRVAREENERARPAPGTILSIFVTNQLGGYREPCS